VPEKTHALERMGGPKGSCMAVGDRIVDLGTEILVKAPGIVPGPHAAPTVGIGRNVTGRVPRGPAGEFVLLDQQGVFHPGFRKMVED